MTLHTSTQITLYRHGLVTAWAVVSTGFQPSGGFANLYLGSGGVQTTGRSAMPVRIDDLRIYTQELAPDIVIGLATGQWTTTSMFLYWPFDQPNGNQGRMLQPGRREKTRESYPRRSLTADM